MAINDETIYGLKGKQIKDLKSKVFERLKPRIVQSLPVSGDEGVLYLKEKDKVINTETTEDDESI